MRVLDGEPATAHNVAAALRTHREAIDECPGRAISAGASRRISVSLRGRRRLGILLMAAWLRAQSRSEPPRPRERAGGIAPAVQLALHRARCAGRRTHSRGGKAAVARRRWSGAENRPGELRTLRALHGDRRAPADELRAVAHGLPQPEPSAHAHPARNRQHRRVHLPVRQRRCWYGGNAVVARAPPS